MFQVSVRLVLPSLHHEYAARDVRSRIRPMSLAATFRTPSRYPNLLTRVLLFGLNLTIRTISTMTFPMFPGVFRSMLARAVVNGTMGNRLLRPLLVALPSGTPNYHFRFPIVLSSLSGVLVNGRVLPTMGRSAFHEVTIATHATYFLVVTFRILQRVVVGSVARVKLISSRSGYVNNCRRAATIVGGVVLVIPTFFVKGSYVVSNNHSTIASRLSTSLLRRLSNRAMSSSAIIQVLRCMVICFLVFVFQYFRYGVGVFPIGSYNYTGKVLGPRGSYGVLPSLLHNYDYGYASRQSF